MFRKLVEKKQLTLINDDFFAINDVSQRAFADIEHFHEIMPVCRKMHKTGMGTDRDQPAFLQHFSAVHGKVPAGGIKVSVHLCLSIQDLSFFFCDLSQLIQ